MTLSARSLAWRLVCRLYAVGCPVKEASLSRNERIGLQRLQQDKAVELATTPGACLRLREHRHLASARRAPTGPEVDDQALAREIRRTQGLAVRVGEGDPGQGRVGFAQPVQRQATLAQQQPAPQQVDHDLDRAHVFHSWSAQGALDPMVISGSIIVTTLR